MAALAAEERDISGVPSSQLKKIVEEHLDVNFGTLAQRTNIDRKYLKRLVLNPAVPVVNLGMADRILLALDLSVGQLIDEGKLAIVPLRKTRASAMRIIEDELWLAREYQLPVPDVEARVAELLAVYEEHCGLTDRMLERREADRARKANS